MGQAAVDLTVEEVLTLGITKADIFSSFQSKVFPIRGDNKWPGCPSCGEDAEAIHGIYVCLNCKLYNVFEY